MYLKDGDLTRLVQQDVFTSNEVKSLTQLTGLPVRKGMEKAIISGGEIVNIVSNSYGHLPNEIFFTQVEEKLINAGVEYVTRSINRDNRSFAVDYILNDDTYHVNVKNGKDTILPMLRFTNSYDGSCKTSGNFGFYRKVCSNGLHVAHEKIGFSVKHRGNITEVVLPEIKAIVTKFMDNEFYSLHKKFEVLAERPITDLSEFVKFTANDVNIFMFEKSKDNPAPSLNAQTVINTIQREANLLGVQPNMWLGYNAFNELLHGKLKKTFEQQRILDNKLLNSVMQYS